MGELSEEEVARQIGYSAIARGQNEPSDIVGLSSESAAEWAKHNVPIMRHYIDAEDYDFNEIFQSVSSYAARIEPVQTPLCRRSPALPVRAWREEAGGRHCCADR